MSSLNIEVGKKYYTRSGGIVKITKKHELVSGFSGIEKFPDGDSIEWRIEQDGRILFSDGSNDKDLVDEVCPHCDGTFGIEIGPGEYTTCSCIDDDNNLEK